MTTRKLLRRIHLAATVWFIVCAGYLVAVGLRQAGLRWWMVLPLSGYSTIGIALVVSLYLFALFRGVDGARRSRIEHPLTSTACYMGFYVSVPLLAGLVAVVLPVDNSGVNTSMIGIAMGTLKGTFFVWIVIDPLAGMIETLSPASRKHGAEGHRNVSRRISAFGSSDSSESDHP